MPSALDDISSVEMLESLITNDPRWAWILGAWEASADDEQVALARTVHRFRSNFVKETAGLVLKLLGDIHASVFVRPSRLFTASVFARPLPLLTASVSQPTFGHPSLGATRAG